MRELYCVKFYNYFNDFSMIYHFTLGAVVNKIATRAEGTRRLASKKYLNWWYVEQIWFDLIIENKLYLIIYLLWFIFDFITATNIYLVFDLIMELKSPAEEALALSFSAFTFALTFAAALQNIVLLLWPLWQCNGRSKTLLFTTTPRNLHWFCYDSLHLQWVRNKMAYIQAQ